MWVDSGFIDECFCSFLLERWESKLQKQRNEFNHERNDKGEKVRSLFYMWD